MKIKNIACSQFAGIRDGNVKFEDGINVIFGKNESGKSTLVNLMGRMIFQDIKLDKRSDKEFYELYFPAALKGSRLKGDFADGKISFEANDNIYTLEKEWGNDARCKLVTPEGIIKDQREINEILREALIYGEGVYTDMLFSPQKNMRNSLENILDKSKKSIDKSKKIDVKKEITDAVSMAFAESDGISMDTISVAIEEKISKLVGKNWDINLNAPRRHPKGDRWQQGVGEVLKAYYEYEDAKIILENIDAQEKNIIRIQGEYEEKAIAATKITDELKEFNKIVSSLMLHSERKQKIERLEEEINKMNATIKNWPIYIERLEIARKLKDELANLETLNRYKKAKAHVDKIETASTANREVPTGVEIKQVKALQDYIAELKNQLCGMNLNAAINMLGDNNIEIISLRTGMPVDITDGVVAINEAVKIVVPGIMEMQLSPANVNVTEIEDKIAQKTAKISDIFRKYEVKTLDELDELARNVRESQSERTNAENYLKDMLGNETFGELEEKAMSVTTACRTKKEIYTEISKVCGDSDVAKFVTRMETYIEKNINDYGSINELKAKVFDRGVELQKAKDTVSVVENIPKEYSGITDPEAHLAMLNNKLEEKNGIRENALTEKHNAKGALHSYMSNIVGDPIENLEKAELKLNEKKALLNHWLHIKEVFEKIKENVHNNPMEDVAESFTNYLSFITGGKVSSEFPDSDKLNINIYSDDRMIDYNKLSEGTKETVSLAFRLAVLDHLFPEGGGVIVLDDPFTDMDLHRMSKSCELLKKCAEKHQVIFLTCREEYADMLCGNEIRI